jgi:tripartite motif-containing protein 71
MNCRRFQLTIPSLFLAATMALLLGAVVPRPASSSAAPAAPTFVLKWGNFGSAPGQFNRLYGVATDAIGNVYVADALNQRIQKFDALGNFITQWGSFGTGNGQFNLPIGVTVDAAGNVYVADKLNHRIQKFDGSGNFITTWGSIGGGHGQFGRVNSLGVGGGFVYVEDDSNSLVQKFDTAGNFVSQWSVSLVAGTAGGVAVDPVGNVYVAESPSNRVQKFDSNGNLLTQWGSAGSGNGQFGAPDGIATDAVGNVYVVDSGNSRVQKFASDGTYLAQWGSLGDGDGQFRWDFLPAGIAVNAAGDVYVTNWTNDNLVHRVQKFSGAGVTLSQAPPSYLLQWGSAGNGNGQFSGPVDVAADAAGNIYVADAGNNRIEKFTSTGAFVAQWDSSGFSGPLSNPVGAATDAAGNVYVPSYFNNRVVKFRGDGTFVTRWGTSGNGNGQFAGPSDVAVDASGTVYVVDSGNYRVQRFDSTGTYLGQWGASGSGNGQFAGPVDMTLDAGGNVYIADSGNHRIQKFTSTGTYISQWGSYGTGNGQFNTPYGMATDAAGDVYVSEFGNHRVQKFTSNGAYLAQWGTHGSGSGQLNNPTGVVVDASGNIYVADYGNNRVEKFVQPPLVALVSDVGNDQGRQARLRILRSSADSPGAGATITGYGIYRRVDPFPGATGASPAAWGTSAAATVGRDGVQLAGWEQVGTISARGDAEYDAVVPTVANANAASVFYTAFMVSAMTSDPLTYFDSGTGYGYSIDNLSPPAPAPFTAAYIAAATHLHWGVNTASDFATFRLYRGSSAGFVPGAGNLVAATTDTGYVDAGPAGSYYKLTAVDLNGNPSPFAILGPGQTTAVGAGALRVFTLEPVRPNPTSGRRLIASFALPVAETARLELIDVAGRRVAARDVGALGAGEHSVDLAEGARIPPGLYFMRLSQGANEQVRRVTVIEP